MIGLLLTFCDRFFDLLSVAAAERHADELRDLKMVDAIDGNIQALLMIRARLLEVSEKEGGE